MIRVRSRLSGLVTERGLRSPEMTYKRDTMPAVLTVRLTKQEQDILAKRSRRPGMKKATFVRKLIRDEGIVTGVDLLLWTERNAGDK